MTNKRLKGTVTLTVGTDVVAGAPAFHHPEYYYKMLKAMEISAAKNHDYCGGEDADPLANFKKVTEAGVPAHMGLLVRMKDKQQRIDTFFKEGELKVVGESIEDALIDLGNYCFLMLALLADEGVVSKSIFKNPNEKNKNENN